MTKAIRREILILLIVIIGTRVLLADWRHSLPNPDKPLHAHGYYFHDNQGFIGKQVSVELERYQPLQPQVK